MRLMLHHDARQGGGGAAGQGNGTTASAAEVAAMSDCGRSDCIPIAWFEHANAAFALGANGDWGWAYDSTAAGLMPAWSNTARPMAAEAVVECWSAR